MSGLPWTQWYWKDWLSDASVRRLSRAARGSWVDLLGMIHMDGDRGEIVISEDEMARCLGFGRDEDPRSFIDELRETGAADVEDLGDSRWKIRSRRIARDTEKRAATRARVRKHREKRSGNAAVTPMKRDTRARVSSQNQSTEPENRTTNNRPSESSDEDSAIVEATDRVIEHYKTRFPGKRPAAAARRKIQARLKSGHTAEDLCRAVDGNAASEWHQDPERCLNGLAWILHSDERVDQFISRANAAGPSNDRDREARKAIQDRERAESLRERDRIRRLADGV